MIPIAESAYYAVKAQEAAKSLRTVRGKRDAEMKSEIQWVRDQNLQVYGAGKVWKQLNRKRVAVARRCTVEWLKGEKGLVGAVRGRRTRTAGSGEDVAFPMDLMDRDFTGKRPNQFWVSDLAYLPYVAIWRGFVPVTFVLDEFRRPIAGWMASSSLPSDSYDTTPWQRR